MRQFSAQTISFLQESSFVLIIFPWQALTPLKLSKALSGNFTINHVFRGLLSFCCFPQHWTFANCPSQQRKWELNFSASGKSRNPEYVGGVFFLFCFLNQHQYCLLWADQSLLANSKDKRLAINIENLCNGWSQSTNTEITIGITGLAVSQRELDQLNPNSSYFYKLACFQPLGTFKCFTNYFNVASPPAWHEGEFPLALRLLCVRRFELPELFACLCWTLSAPKWKLPLTFASLGLTGQKTRREQHPSLHHSGKLPQFYRLLKHWLLGKETQKN